MNQSKSSVDMRLSRMRAAYKEVRRAYRKLEKDGTLRAGSGIYRGFYTLMDEFRREEKRLVWELQHTTQLYLFEEKTEPLESDSVS